MKKFQSPSCETCKSRLDSVFCNLSGEELSDLSVQKHCYCFNKGETIFTEGNLTQGLFCIRNGKIKIYHSAYDGKEQIIRLAKDGDILGYRALICGETYSASAAALEYSEICLIPKELFSHLLNNNPGFTNNIMKLLTNELKTAQNKIVHLAQKSIIERLAEVILMLEEYHGDEVKDDCLDITISREDIANIAGSSTESAIRLLNEMKKKGIIDLEGKKIKILRKDKLIRLANLCD